MTLDLQCSEIYFVALALGSPPPVPWTPSSLRGAQSANNDDGTSITANDHLPHSRPRCKPIMHSSFVAGTKYIKENINYMSLKKTLGYLNRLDLPISFHGDVDIDLH
jgi:hypothetical protein